MQGRSRPVPMNIAVPRILVPAAFAAGLALVPALRADVFLDQIGLPANYVTDLTSMAATSLNQITPSPSLFPDISSGVFDDFTITHSIRITTVEAALETVGTFPDVSTLSTWHVAVFSQPLDGSTLQGDVAYVLPSSVTITPITTGGNTSALISASVSLDLPAVGTYWVGLIPTYDNVGTFYMLANNATSGGQDAYFASPSGFDGSGSTGADAALRVTGELIPEAPTTGAMLAGAGAAAFALARARARRREIAR